MKFPTYSPAKDLVLWGDLPTSPAKKLSELLNCSEPTAMNHLMGPVVPLLVFRGHSGGYFSL